MNHTSELEVERLKQLCCEQEALIKTLREQIRNLIALHAPPSSYGLCPPSDKPSES